MLNKIVLVCLTILVAFPGQLYAGCEKPVSHLVKDQKAPCEGYLFSPEKELEVRIKNENYKLLLEQTKIYLQQITLFKSQVVITEEIAEKEKKKAELWRTRAETITEKYVTQEERRGWRDWMFISAGVLLTIGAGWGVGQASK